MLKIWAVAKNTFIEAIRDRVLYSLVLFAFLMIASSIVLSSLSAEQHNKFVKDFALASISIFGIMLSIFLGIGLVYKEIEKKTVYNIFSKPLYRYQFIIGKYIGIALTILIITIFMFLISLLIVSYFELSNKDFILFYYGGHFFQEFIIAVFFQYLEFLIIIGIALVLSSFTTPIIAVLLSFLAVAIGRTSSDIKHFAEEVENPFVSVLSEILYRVIPNLEKFNFRSEAVYGGKITETLLINTTVYALLYVVVLLFLSIIIFERREFK
ncbi:MAG: ABC transporter permease [Thermodesulfobacteriota bacterium]